MTDGITVKELAQMVLQEIKNGNGDKRILISQDDEGNGFHTLYYGFTSDKKTIKAYADNGVGITDINEIILLG